jgi:hypothetical protein
VKSDGERRKAQKIELHHRQRSLLLSMSDYAVSRKEAEVKLMTMHRRQVFVKLHRVMEELTTS